MFHRVDGHLMVESLRLSELAERFGTPCYVYSKASILRNWCAYDMAFGTRAHRIYYAVKACSNIAILQLLQRAGSGFDIVSGGELCRVLAAGARGADIVFSGVGKSRAELAMALDAQVACLNVESPAELLRLEQVAASHGVRAPIALRVNPDVDAKTHPYISTGLEENKFGVPIKEALAIYRRAADSPHFAVVGVACHIGSQLTDLAPIRDTVARVVALATELENAGIPLQHVDFGGGLGIRYVDETPPSADDYVTALAQAPAHWDIHIEPGRSIVGNAGVLLSTVEYLKQNGARHFAICDAAMTELIRPALYEAWHDVELLNAPPAHAVKARYELVGPVCESADFLARARALTLTEGSRLAFMNAGAYGFVMASNYNTRARPPEILVDGDQAFQIRRRETIPELLAAESLLR